jgi:hypothetical protein
MEGPSLINPGGRVQQGLIAVVIEDGDVLTRRRGGAENVGVLVEGVRMVGVGDGVLNRRLPVADGVEGVGVTVRAQQSRGQLGACVVIEGIGTRHVARADLRTLGQAIDRIVRVGPLRQNRVLPATLAAYKVPFCGRSVLVGVSEITI